MNAPLRADLGCQSILGRRGVEDWSKTLPLQQKSQLFGRNFQHLLYRRVIQFGQYLVASGVEVVVRRRVERPSRPEDVPLRAADLNFVQLLERGQRRLRQHQVRLDPLRNRSDVMISDFSHIQQLGSNRSL